MPITETEKLARRRRRRKRRAIAVLLSVIGAVGLAWFFESQATTTLIFVRHADRVQAAGDDPGLSTAGAARAIELRRLLGDADVVAGVDEIYVTQYRRSQETAAPLARALNIDVRSYDAADTVDVLRRILERHKGKIVLVVGHSNTIAPMIAELGGSKKVPAIAEGEYDNLYIVTMPWFGKTKTLRLKYGSPYRPPAAERATG